MPWISIPDCDIVHPGSFEGEEVAGGWKNTTRHMHQHFLVVHDYCCEGHSMNLIGFLDRCQDNVDPDPCKDC